MQADLHILTHFVVEGGGLPVLCEEDHADRLAEVVELEACAADGRHDGGIGDGFGWDAEFAGSEDEVCVGCCAG